jgi:hypothetical protein
MKRRLLWFIELFVWLLVLFLVSSGIMFAKYNYKKTFDTYQIFLPDVDGLIVGSPVKFMGIQIGYVNQLNITGEDIYVNFIITDTDVEIPHGAKATVEFSGLGGSKSLELYPPTAADKESTMFIVPQPPKRIHDSLGLLNDMFETTVQIAYDVSHFMEKMGFLKQETGRGERGTGNGKRNDVTPSPEKDSSPIHPFTRSPIKQVCVGDLMDKCNCWLDKMQEQNNKFNESIKKKKVGKNGINGTN